MPRPFMPFRVFALLLLCPAWLAIRPPAAAAAPPPPPPLTADGLVLVVNRNAPAGVELAKHYAQVRGVPTGRIVELDLPDTDEISLDDYERLIAEPLLSALRDPSVGGKVRCLVTFTGVPFRIAARPKDPSTLAELRLIGEHRRAMDALLGSAAGRAEALAARTDPSFRPPAGRNVSVGDRLRAAAQFGGERIGGLADAAAAAEIERAWDEMSVELQKPVSLPPEPPATAPAATGRSTTEPAALPPGTLRFGSAGDRRDARAAVRASGPLRYEQLLALQADFLTFDQPDAAVDSELATLPWGPHPRAKWLLNPLRYDVDRSRPAPPTLMVMRLDGPSPAVVRRMIDDAVAVERDGLGGQVVLDTWNKPANKPDGSPDGYGVYDETIRRLERVVATKTGLKLTFEATDQLIGGDKAADGIAAYCGWYDPNRVQLPGTFARGAVGFHVASYTAVGIRGQGGGWWVPAMLEAGAAATLGPVSEPYLTAFPKADEFFPLLFTGRLTLAEVYWRTTPMVSWKMLAIGDPLYTPYKSNPAIRVEDLPAPLRSVLESR